MNTASQSPLPILFDPLQIDTLPAHTQARIAQIDALLPQTQCGLCGYRDGCLPYAYAIAVNDEATNLCVPGGDKTAYAIAQCVGVAPKPAMPSKWPTDPVSTRPIEVYAIIDESACIGCTKCIPACPVDAIIGTGKHMHSVASELCTGCELCVAPCPVDCISIAPKPKPTRGDTRKQQQEQLRQRYYAHLNRLTTQLKNNRLTIASHTEAKLANQLQQRLQQTPQINTTAPDESLAKQTVYLAKLRSQIKKLSKQLAMRADPDKQKTLNQLIQELAQQEQSSTNNQTQ